MSPQRDGETQEMYMYRLEMTQERHEEALERANGRISTVELVALEAREMATGTNSMVASMPHKIIEAIDARNHGKGLSLQGWVNLFCAVVVALVAVWGIVK
jgi:hypothetical protein